MVSGECPRKEGNLLNWVPTWRTVWNWSDRTAGRAIAICVAPHLVSKAQSDVIPSTVRRIPRFTACSHQLKNTSKTNGLGLFGYHPFWRSPGSLLNRYDLFSLPSHLSNFQCLSVKTFLIFKIQKTDSVSWQCPSPDEIFLLIISLSWMPVSSFHPITNPNYINNRELNEKELTTTLASSSTWSEPSWYTW